eukprot:746755-Hanusia_phi.AAC.4
MSALRGQPSHSGFLQPGAPLGSQLEGSSLFWVHMHAKGLLKVSESSARAKPRPVGRSLPDQPPAVLFAIAGALLGKLLHAVTSTSSR